MLRQLHSVSGLDGFQEGLQWRVTVGSQDSSDGFIGKLPETRVKGILKTFLEVGDTRLSGASVKSVMP
jgi:hypothetical protein